MADEFYRDPDDSWLDSLIVGAAEQGAGAWGNTGGKVWDAITGRFPQDSPLDQAGDILGHVGKYTGGALVDLVNAGINLPPWLAGADPWIENPVGGMDWFDQNLLAEAPTADQDWRDLMAQDTRWDEASQSWVPFTPQEQVWADEFTSGPGFIDESMADVIARTAPVEVAAPVAAGPSVAELVAQLVALKEKGVTDLSASRRGSLDRSEVTRLERLRSDEADAFARLKELEAARVEQEERVAGKIAKRGEDAIADWATRVADAEDRMADLGIAGFGRLEAADLRGAGALGRQSGRQQTLTDRLGQIAADEAVGRSMDLGSTYDQAGLDLADALWAARAKIDEDEMAQLQSIAEAALAAEVQAAQSAAAYAPMEQFFGAMGGAPIPGFVQSADQAGVLDTILGAMLRDNDPETQMDTGGLAAQFPDLAQWGLGPGVVMTLDEIKQIVDLAGSPFIQAGS